MGRKAPPDQLVLRESLAWLDPRAETVPLVLRVCRETWVPQDSKASMDPPARKASMDPPARKALKEIRVVRALSVSQAHRVDSVRRAPRDCRGQPVKWALKAREAKSGHKERRDPSANLVHRVERVMPVRKDCRVQ